MKVEISIGKWALVFLVLLFVPMAFATTYNLSPSDDSWVDNNVPTSNYGTQDNLRYGSYTYIYMSFIRFNLSNYNISSSSQIKDAILYLYTYNGSGSNRNTEPLAIGRITNTTRAYNWTEGTITYNNKPATTIYDGFFLNNSKQASCCFVDNTSKQYCAIWANSTGICSDKSQSWINLTDFFKSEADNGRKDILTFSIQSNTTSTLTGGYSSIISAEASATYIPYRINMIMDIDTTPPSISDIDVNTTNLYINNSVRINATITDDTAISSARFLVQAPDYYYNLSYIGNSGSHYWIFFTPNQSGQYNITSVEATDAYNNSISQPSSVNFSVSIPNEAPSITLIAPANNSTNNPLQPNLTATINDTDSEFLNITFYNASDNSIICEYLGETANTTLSCNWTDATKNSWHYDWYANITDGTNTTQSETWGFETIMATPAPSGDITSTTNSTIYVITIGFVMMCFLAIFIALKKKFLS